MIPLAAFIIDRLSIYQISRKWWNVLCIACLGAVIISMIVEVFLNSRSKRRLLEASYQICTCGYNLGAQGANGTCPECGEPYTVTALRSQWEAAYRSMGWRKRSRRQPPSTPSPDTPR